MFKQEALCKLQVCRWLVRVSDCQEAANWHSSQPCRVADLRPYSGRPTLYC